MPIRFSRRKQLFPGVRLNVSKSGPSLTFGGHGFHYTVGRRGHRTTVGIPGTGLYYTNYSPNHARAATRKGAPGRQVLRTRTPRVEFAPPAEGRAQAQSLGPLDAAPPSPPVATHPPGPSLVERTLDLLTSSGRARRLLDRAHHAGDAQVAKRLIDQAAALAPRLPDVLGAEAAWTAAQYRWRAAADLYVRYLTAVPNDHQARAQYARCLLLAGYPDGAIEQFVLLRPFPFNVDGQASITAHLSIAFLMKGDAQQALALLNEAPLRSSTLSLTLQQCLHLRAVAQYMLGHPEQAIADLDRLWALNPWYPDLTTDKAAMQAGAYMLASPAGPIGPAGLTTATADPGIRSAMGPTRRG